VFYVYPPSDSRPFDNDYKFAATHIGAFVLLLKEGETGFSRLGGKVNKLLDLK
jgi:hypothetical protein